MGGNAPALQKERGFQTSLCKQGAGIAQETIAMAMVEGLEKQLSPPEKKFPVLKRFCPRPVAKCPPATSKSQHRAYLAASPHPLLPGTAMDVQPHAQTPTRHRNPMEEGDGNTLGSAQRPRSLPQPQAAVLCGTHGSGAPPMTAPTFQSVSTAERKASEFSWGKKEPSGREMSPSPPLTPTVPSSHPTREAPGHQKHPLPRAVLATGGHDAHTRAHTHTRICKTCTCTHTHKCV